MRQVYHTAEVCTECGGRLLRHEVERRYKWICVECNHFEGWGATRSGMLAALDGILAEVSKRNKAKEKAAKKLEEENA